MTVINNFDTWIALSRLVNVQQNGQIPPGVFDTWYNDVSDWYLQHLVERYQLTQVISDLMYPYVLIANKMVTTQPGQNWGLVTYPSDYQYFLNATLLRQKAEEKCFISEEFPLIDDNGAAKKYTDPDFAQMKVNFAGYNVEETQINAVDSSRWAACLNHATKNPTWKNPKMTQFNNGFKVAPKGINSVLIYYVKTPVKSVMAYTISNDIAIYNAAGSTQLEWSNQVSPVFLSKLVSKYGIYIDNANYVKMGEEMLASALTE